jgi:hypothetical protein
MLDTPNEKTNRILQLADFIENLPPENYKQSSFTSGPAHCICGWIMERLGREDYSNVHQASDYLGLNYYQGEELFCGAPILGPNWNSTKVPTNLDAARVLRHLAITGKVDWSICAKKKELVDA